MKPLQYITEDAKDYFKEIVPILKARGMAKDEFNIELSMLCQEYAIYEDAVKKYKTEGSFTNSHDQIAAYITAKDKALANIVKMSPKFGLTPLDFSKISELVEKPEEEKGIDKI